MAAAGRETDRMAETLGYNPAEVKQWRQNPEDYEFELAVYDSEYDDFVRNLEAKEFSVDSDPPFLVRDKDGNKLFSDMDLHGYYDMDGKNAWPQGNDEALLKLE